MVNTSDMAGVSGQDMGMAQLMMPPSAAEAMYEAHMRGYAIKSEKGMPPTPPGKPVTPVAIVGIYSMLNMCVFLSSIKYLA